MEWFLECYPYIEKDIVDVLEYIPMGIVIGISCGLAVCIILRLWTKEWDWKRFSVLTLLSIYFVVVMQIAYFSRVPGSRTDVTLGFMDTWGTTMQAHAYVIENVLMFIPFGVLFPLLGRKALYCCIPMAVLVSTLIEGMQYITGRGYCQLDDVVANTTGAILGYVVILIITGIRKLRNR